MNILSDLIVRYPCLKSCEAAIQHTFTKLKTVFTYGNRLYICGNGGSASDALHIVGELAKSFRLPRNLDQEFIENVSPEVSCNLQGALPAFALVENAALSSAYANDVNPEYIFAQQVYAYVRKGDCVMGISTSGNSKNVLRALETAKGRGAVTIGLTGSNGGAMKSLCSVCITVPETETYKIQELHLSVYHALCAMLEEYFWGTP